MSEIKDAVEDAARTVKEELKTGRQAAESVPEQAGQAARTAQDALHQARDRATEGEHQLGDLVRRSPLSAVLICLGLGFLIAFLWKRRG